MHNQIIDQSVLTTLRLFKRSETSCCSWYMLYSSSLLCPTYTTRGSFAPRNTPAASARCVDYTAIPSLHLYHILWSHTNPALGAIWVSFDPVVCSSSTFMTTTNRIISKRDKQVKNEDLLKTVWSNDSPFSNNAEF